MALQGDGSPMNIDSELAEIAEFWSARYRAEGFIWGTEASPCAHEAATHFAAADAKRVLVLGCGYGRDAVYFANQGFDVTAIDFATEALALAESWATSGDGAGQIEYVRDNLVALNVPDSAYDAVYSHRTLHLLLTRERLIRAVAEIHRVLKPGGIACISMRSPRDPTREKTRGSAGEDLEVSFRPGHRILFLSNAELGEIAGRCFSTIGQQEMRERESKTQNYDVIVHFLVLGKEADSRRGFAETGFKRDE